MKTQTLHSIPVEGLLEALRAGNAVSDSEQYLTGLDALRIDHQHELEQQVLNLQNQIKNLQRNVKELREYSEELRADKKFLKDQLELKLISIDTSTTFIKQMFTTPDKKTKPKTKVQKSKEDEINEITAFMLRPRGR